MTVQDRRTSVQFFSSRVSSKWSNAGLDPILCNDQRIEEGRSLHFQWTSVNHGAVVDFLLSSCKPVAFSSLILVTCWNNQITVEWTFSVFWIEKANNFGIHLLRNLYPSKVNCILVIYLKSLLSVTLWFRTLDKLVGLKIGSFDDHTERSCSTWRYLVSSIVLRPPYTNFEIFAFLLLLFLRVMLIVLMPEDEFQHRLGAIRSVHCQNRLVHPKRAPLFINCECTKVPHH